MTAEVGLARPTVEAIFLEDVSRFLDANGVRAAPRLKLTGDSGLDHRFDFVIPASPTQPEAVPERVIKAIGTPNREHVVELMFSWQDVRPNRSPNAKAYAFLNDQERPVNSDLLMALGKYGVMPVKWSARAQYLDALRA